MSDQLAQPAVGNLADPAARQALTSGFEATPGASKPDPILRVDNIVRQFGGMTAVDVQHLEVQRGLITALIGPNGAGKTTFFNLITGFDRPTTAGKGAHWEFDGRTIDKTSASSVARSGMVRTFQLTKALSAMTVIDNMMLGAQDQAGENLFKSMFRSTLGQPGEGERGQGRRAPGPLQAPREEARLRRQPLGRSAQAARDGPGADERSRR